MIQIKNKVLFNLLSFSIGALVGFIIFGNFWAVVVGLLFFIAANAGIVTVPINKQSPYKNRWSGELSGSVSEGYYWHPFGKYELTDEVDATPNEFRASVEAQTSNNITIKLDASLWVSVRDALLFKRIGTDDVKRRIQDDWEDTLKTYIAANSDEDLRKKANTFEIKQGDTLRKTLRDCGMHYTDGEISYSIGEIKLPKSVEDANEALSNAKRVADAEDFKNKENSKKVTMIFIEKLLPFISKSIRELRIQAINSLGLDSSKTFSHDEEYEITDKMLSIAISLAKGSLTPQEISVMRIEAETDLNVREGRTTAYTGLAGAGIMPTMNIGKK